MTTRSYTIENLGCPNCAVKMERAIASLPGVEAASISYPNKLLRMTSADHAGVIAAVQAVVESIEPGTQVIPRQSGAHKHTKNTGIVACAHTEAHCGGCDHAHDHHAHTHTHAHAAKTAGIPVFLRDEKTTMIGGGVLFGVVLMLQILLSRWGVEWTALQWALAYALPYVVLSADVWVEAWHNIRRGDIFDENFLMLLASVCAFAIRDFPEASAVMLFYRVGEFFEHRAVEKSRAAIMETVDMRPETVSLVGDDGTTHTIPASEALVGDRVVVLPGGRIPLDGRVVSGTSRVDTSPVTGEPMPVAVSEGSSVVSGCVNLSGMIHMRVEKPLSESMVTRILDAVENAAANKPRMEQFITRFARVYTPVVCAIALLVAVTPPLLGVGAWSEWIHRGLAFLVVSCPCALVLSVPLAFFAGIGAGSRKGILVKGGASLEALNGIRAVVFDKTGTLTRGVFEVQRVHAIDRSEHELLALAANAERYSTHPIAESLRRAADAKGLPVETPQGVDEIAGYGLNATLSQGTVLVGNRKFLAREGVALPTEFDEQGTTVYVAVDGIFAGAIAIEDAIKDDAREAIAALKRAGYTTAMLTGDNEAGAARVAQHLGIDTVQSRMLPDQKLDALRAIRRENGPSLYVGDGINDAPVLAGADVGAAMGSGADAAIEAADVVYMNAQVGSVGDSLSIARHTRRIATQNVAFALAVKAVVMLLSLFMASPNLWLAVFADVGVALLCVANSVRILRMR